jgi:hypothetical protein
MKEQWKQGLQWGGVIWLAWLSLSSLFCIAGPTLITAIGWTLAFALAWTRWSRLGVALGIAAQVYVGVVLGHPIVQVEHIEIIDGPAIDVLNVAPLLDSFLPSCLPLLPLLFMRPTRPTSAIALALVGRWEDAARELNGFRWILVAAGVIALHTGLPGAARWWNIDQDGKLVFAWANEAANLGPIVILFGLAALPSGVTVPGSTRGGASTKDEWSKGLQWGGVAWLVWLVMSTVGTALRCAGAGAGFVPQFAIPAIGWTVALALTWTRWSRVGIAIGITAQVYAGVVLGHPILERVDYRLDGVMTESYLDLAPLLSSFLPRCLPLLPLLFVVPSRPRYAAALALVGRWTDAAREFAGLRWILVAAGVLALHSAAPEALEWWTIDEHGRVGFDVWRVAGALLPCLILFGVAAIRDPRERLVSAT